MTNTKHTTPQIPVKDIYSVRDAAILLGTTKDRVREDKASLGMVAQEMEASRASGAKGDTPPSPVTLLLALLRFVA